MNKLFGMWVFFLALLPWCSAAGAASDDALKRAQAAEAVSEIDMIRAGADENLPAVFDTLVEAYGKEPPVAEMMKRAIARNLYGNIRFLKAVGSGVDWSKVNLLGIVYESPFNTGYESLGHGKTEDRIAIQKYLLAQGFPVDGAEADSGYTPLMQACRAFRFDPADVEFLLDAGASADAVDAAGYNALFYLLSSCFSHRSIEALELLLRHGAPLRQQNPGFNLLFAALAAEQPPEVIARLVELGEDVNFKTKDGVTPLMLAALLYRSEVAELLLRHGAKINARDATGWSPLFYASYLFPGAFECGVNFQPRNRYKMDAAATIQLLLAHGADAGLVDDFGASALTEAAAWCDAETVRQLTGAGGRKTGTDSNSRMRKGEYPVRQMSRVGFPCSFNPETFGVASVEAPADSVWCEPPLCEAVRRDREEEGGRAYE